MIFKGKDNESKVVIINCNCGCDEAIQIKKFTFDDDMSDYFISILAGEFSTKQRGIFRTIGHRIKLAFKMLLGKEYLLTDIVLTHDELKEYINVLSEQFKEDKGTENE